MADKVRIVLVASGSGTDANAVMGHPPSNGEIVALLSTVEGAGCLEKARNHKVPTHVIARKNYPTQEDFERAVTDWFLDVSAQVVFLLGCIHLMPVLPSISMYNIHPADPIKHGGKHMYGLEPHKHVLDEVRDLIRRGMATLESRFWTYPTVHEATGDYDQGKMFMQTTVEIPPEIVKISLTSQGNLKAAAEMLQKYVLAYEHLMLPAAVEMACHKFLSAGK